MPDHLNPQSTSSGMAASAFLGKAPPATVTATKGDVEKTVTSLGKQKPKDYVDIRVPSMKTWFEKADSALRIFTFLVVVAAVLWAIYQYGLTESNDSTDNITLETKVLPYHDNLRLLVVHVKAKNPRNYEFALNSDQGDSFKLCLRKIATDAKENTVIGEDEGELIKKVDLMLNNEGKYEFPAGVEIDDMRTIVLPANTTVSLIAEMKIHNGDTDEHGGPAVDLVSSSTVVHIDS